MLVAGLVAWADRPALGGPAKRYMGQPVSGPEADPLSESTLHGLERGLSGPRWPTSRPSRSQARAATAPAQPADQAPIDPSHAGRYLAVGVATMTGSSLVLLSLLLWKRRRARRTAAGYIRYAISLPDRKPWAT